jgi:tetratricopeptide (TPR) repeat protein
MTKKKQQKKETPAAPTGSVFWSVGQFIGMILLLILLSINIAGSQMVHPLYEGVVRGNKLALVTFFKIAKDLAAFQPLKPEMDKTYQTLANEIDKDNITRQEKINKLESVLSKSPKSRDILYALSVLYRDSGNPIKADEYLQKAREIDPSVGK